MYSSPGYFPDTKWLWAPYNYEMGSEERDHEQEDLDKEYEYIDDILATFNAESGRGLVENIG